LSDVIEHKLFGPVDREGEKAVRFFSEYAFNENSSKAFRDILTFLGAQKFRTPKGLAFLRMVTKTAANQDVLPMLEELLNFYSTIWIEGIWEVIECRDSAIKFIVSDHPVTTYNKDLFPGNPSCSYPKDAEVERIGTHTVYPLDPEHCLVITNLEYARNPWASPTAFRLNPRYYAETVVDLRRVQTGRQIPESDVQAVNFILKSRARRFIASPMKEWLYPEKTMKTTHWSKLGLKYFLLPDPRKFLFITSSLYGGGGRYGGQDEYGRAPSKDPMSEKKRQVEWASYHKFQQAWDTMYGPLSPEERRKFL
jgi:hypothetical protein